VSHLVEGKEEAENRLKRKAEEEEKNLEKKAREKIEKYKVLKALQKELEKTGKKGAAP
jgi:hypothetical protein